MPIAKAFAGEDVPIRVEYTDSGGAATDPDDQDADGDADAFVTIIDNADGTELISSVEMAKLDVGIFEYVWDTSVDANGAGSYRVEIDADFGGETKIEKDGIVLEA